MILKLDFASEVPIYLQIRNQIVLGVADGRLKPGERLPTIRALADEAGVNTMTVNKAYALLKQEGVIVADRRSGARVREPEADGKENGRSQNRGLSEKSLQELRLIIAEAKLSGMDWDDFLSLCAKEYEGAEARVTDDTGKRNKADVSAGGWSGSSEDDNRVVENGVN